MTLTPTTRAHLELRKLLTLRGTYVLAAITALFPTVVTGLRLGLPDEDPRVEFAARADRVELLGGVIAVQVLVVALGALLTAGEWRHRTATTTFLAEPRRWRVVVAQIAVAAGAGAVVGIVGTAAVRLTATIALGMRDAPTDFGPDQWATMAGAVVSCVGAAVMGAGLGAAVRNPALAAVAVAGGGPLVDLTLGAVSTDLADAVSLPLALERLVGDDGGGALQLSGLVCLAAWAAVSAAVGLRRTATADVT